MNYLGVDCHKFKSYLTAMDAAGTVLGRWNINNEARELDRIFDILSDDVSAVLEASASWPVMYDMLEERAKKVTLAHPYKVRAIADAKIKNDKIDSKVLADLLRANLIPEAYAPGKETRHKKSLLRYRASLVSWQTMIKNAVHAVLTRNHVPLSEQQAISDLFGKKGRQYLENVTLAGQDREIMGGYLRILDFVRVQINEAEKLIAQLITADGLIRKLMSIPGLGAVMAPLIRYEVDHIERFRTSRKFLCYCALVPGLYASASRSHTTGILKQGNKFLKWAFIEAVSPAVRSSVVLRAYYTRIKGKSGHHAARVAVARKIARIAYHVMKDNKEFDETLIRDQR